MMFSARTRFLLALAILIGGAFIYAIEFTDWHQLQAVTLDGEPVENFGTRLGLDDNRPITHQPLDRAAVKLLKRDSVARVDFDYVLPNELRIETNKFKPLCMVVDRQSGRILGLNPLGRVVPLRDDYGDWEHPVITGVAVGGIFEPCRDSRVQRLMPQLQRLQDDSEELFRLIEELDFSDSTYVKVVVSGLPYTLKVTAESFCEQMTGFVRFLERYEPVLDSARQFDLRYADMIIQRNGSR